MKKLVIIPAYNEEKTILGVVKDITENVPDYDYIVINDGSTDNTKKICEENQIRFLDLASNLGIGGAVQTGYQYACLEGYDVAVQIDGDGQHKAENIRLLENSLNADGTDSLKADMVIGSRFIDKKGFQSTGIRRFGIKYMSWLIHLLTKGNITDPSSGMRIVNRKIIKEFSAHYSWDFPEPESNAYILKSGYKVVEVPVEMRERQGGKSSLAHPLKAVFYMIKISEGIIMETMGRKKV